MDESNDLRYRILLVDDENNYLWSVARALDVKGYHVATADSMDRALEILKAEHMDLVLTDIKMPGLDGFELVEWLRVHRPDTAVVMATAFGSMSMREKALNLGAISYIEKPIDLNALMDFLQNLFHAPGFTGRIRDIDLLDYLQLVSNTHKTKIVQVTNRRSVGRLVFENGALVHAQCQQQEGLSAFYEIVSWHTGAFTDIPYEPPPVRSIDGNTSFLLIEAARMRDERERHSGHVHLPVHPPRAASESRASSPAQVRARDASDDRMTGPFGRFRRFLEGLDSFKTVRGSVLMSREGLILARGGTFPAGLEGVISRLSEAYDVLGEGLELDPFTRGQVVLADGSVLQVLPVATELVSVWLSGEIEAREVAAWLRGRAFSLE